MNSNYSWISNGIPMLILCGITIIAVLIQAVYFYRKAWRHGVHLGIEPVQMKQVTISSAIFSIVPSLPILISYLMLLPALGKYLPWVRLSVIGSAAYETMAADLAVKAYGYTSLTDAFSPEAYVSIAWVVTLAILLSSASTFLLKPYDKQMRKVQAKGNTFMPLMVSAMFLGLLGSMSAPYLVGSKDITSLLTILFSGACFIGLTRMAKRFPMLKEFAFALSMLMGMTFASVYTYFMV